MLAIDVLKVIEGALFAVEKLHHAHPRDVLLRKAVDAPDGSAYAPITLPHMVAEEAGDDEDEG